MDKTALLARPHPFMAREMRPFLEKMGYGVSVLDELGQIDTETYKANGVIISLALSSSINESAEDVFVAIRQHAPQLPVVFASLLNFSRVERVLEKIVNKMYDDPTILSVGPRAENSGQLGKATTFIYVSKDDFSSMDRQDCASRMIKGHFH